MEQLNLFTPEWPPGFSYYSDFISPEEEMFLLLLAQDLQWESYEMHGVASLRKIYRFGVNYRRNEDSEEEFRPIPKEMQFILARGARALNVTPQEIKQVLFTYYPVG